MKRIFAVLLVALSLCACSSGEVAQTQSTTAVNSLVAQQQNYETGANGERIIEGSVDQVLFQNDFCSMTLNKAEIDSLSDYRMDVTLVNRTDTAQVFTFKHAYVNDYDFDPLWVAQVEAGQTVTADIIWTAPAMQERGIAQVTRVDFELCVYAADAPDSVFANEEITLYPSVKSTHITQTRSRVTTDIDVVDNEEIKFVIVSYDGDNRWGKALEVYAQNKTDVRLTFTLENVTINDQPLDPHWRYELNDNKQGNRQILFLDSDLEKLQLEGTLELEYELVVYRENGTELARIPHTFVP